MFAPSSYIYHPLADEMSPPSRTAQAPGDGRRPGWPSAGSSAERSEELPEAQAKVAGYLDCEAELTSVFFLRTVPSILRKRLFVVWPRQTFFHFFN